MSQVLRVACAAQSGLVVQATHTPVEVLHAGVRGVPAHPVLPVQPVTHWLVAVLQTWPASPQSPFETQRTHVPAGEQTRLVPMVHWEFPVHATQR